MLNEVEISSFDLRYESYRLKNPAREKALLVSILEQGILEPLQGADTPKTRILLNGFKRCRCAQKLAIHTVPYISIGTDEAIGIINLLRIANAKNLNIMEQARLIDELKTVHKMSTEEIARLLEKSKGWVGMRFEMLKQISPCIMEKILNGEFPVYSYMYTLRPFMRMNGIKKEEIDEFVVCVSGKNLSLRDIQMLAHGYFKGSADYRAQIKNGHISWSLNWLKENNSPSSGSSGCSELEKAMLRDLEIIEKYMHKVILSKLSKDKYKSNSFHAQANLLSGEILNQIESFVDALEEFHDRTKQTSSDLLPQ